jgi:hypothetical protein
LTCKAAQPSGGDFDAFRLSNVVWIKGAQDNTCMLNAIIVQPPEVLAVQGKYAAPLC